MKSPADQQTKWGNLSRSLLASSPNVSLRLLVLAAHPDDETIGASFLLAKFRHSYVAFITDGAPRDEKFWTGGPYGSRDDYAEARRKEAFQALGCSGVSEERIFWLGAIDQEAISQVGLLATKLAGLLRELQPDLLMTHPYEGGHPDHDSAALIAQLAVSQLSHEGPEVIEMTSYHARDGQCVTGDFLHSECSPELVVELSQADRARKKKMFDAHTSQRLLLGQFGSDRERFRKAPKYDFSQPPHEGKLWYECMGWPMTGERWRKLARTAILGVEQRMESHSCG